MSKAPLGGQATGPNLTDEITLDSGYTPHIRARAEEKQQKQEGKKPRRWVVERTHSWINRFRRLLVRWEKKQVNYLAFLQLAAFLIIYKQN